MTSVVEVRFKGNRLEYFTWQPPEPLAVDDPVIVEVERGQDLGHVSALGESALKKCGRGCHGCTLQEAADTRATRRIVRRASSGDVAVADQLRQQEEDVRRTVRTRVTEHGPVRLIVVTHGLVIAAILSVPVTLLCLPAEPIFRWLREPPDVVPLAAGFVRMSAPGTLPFFTFVVLRLSLQAMKHLRPVLVTIAAANLVNAGLNWVLVYGHLGFPAMGAVGSALSSTIGRWIMAATLLALSWTELRPQLAPFGGRQGRVLSH